MKYFIGIDNGINGAVVVIDENGKVVSKYVGSSYTIKGEKTEYDVTEMVEILKEFDREYIEMVTLERAQAFPGQGVVSMFNIGRGYGLWEGIIKALGLRYTIVHPKTWQKEILKDLNKTDTKQASAIYAQRMCPNVDWRISEKGRKIHDGLTDAFCMAEYGKQLMK